MSLSPKDVEKKLEKGWQENTNLWLHAFYEGGEVEPELLDIPGLPKIEIADVEGGEGDGAEIWVTIKVGDQYFQKYGYYSSWGDSAIHGDVYEVFPKQVMRTEWSKKK